MTDCEKYSGLIEDLIEGELDEHMTGQAESHVFACQKCREQYEMLWREKKIYAQYLFDAEPPPDSWINFQARLVAERKIPDDTVIPADPFRRRKRAFVFGFSPALAAFAGLLLIVGIGFVWLRTSLFNRDGDKYGVETKLKDLQSPLLDEINRNPAVNLPPQNVGNDFAVPQTAEPAVRNTSLKAKNKSLAVKKSFAAETLLKRRKSDFLNQNIKSANDTGREQAQRLTALQMENLETEIAVQMEKVELLLRSFRNARANETVEGFDVEYEKKQARKLLEKNAGLRRAAENYGISDAEELLSQIEPYLLDIANLETNPAPDKVLDIKERVSNQNIIASLQVY